VIRKILYSLIAVSLVFVVNQVKGVGGTTGTATPIVTSVMTGSVEVCISASQGPAEVSAADLTISSVEIYLASGWAEMKMENANKVDLTKIDGSEQQVATTTDLNPGTYTQIRMNIARVDITLKGKQPTKAKLSSNMLSCTHNFQVSARNTTVLVIKINDTDRNQIIFNPVATLLFTTPGAMQLITTSLPQGEVGVAYYAKLMAIGGQQPYNWSITMGDLPTGLNLNQATGVISGTPTVTGNFYFLAVAYDSSSVRKSTIATATGGGVVNPSNQGLSIKIIS
jgi:hypothetical protein